MQASATAAHAVTAIGSHGQTIRHEPDAARPYSLQLGDPGVIAAQTGIDVVADFRHADIEAGGQGAPLAPAFHAATLASRDEPRVVLNLGGIANITTLPATHTTSVTGFDTGPASTLMDYWARTQLHTAMDEDGRWAAGGTPDGSLLEHMLADAYFAAAPPKSTGREHFNTAWLHTMLGDHKADAQTVMATLCELTARSVAAAVLAHAGDTRRVIVCGGGVHNDLLMQRLQAYLPDMAVESSMLHGIDPDWVEAAAFAWLAQRRLAGLPGNLPSVTGAKQAVLPGDIYRHQ